MPTVQLHPDSKGDMAKRLSDKLKPSNDFGTADVHVQKGTSPQRVHHTIHHSASQSKSNPALDPNRQGK